jgi:hypothetical protein
LCAAAVALAAETAHASETFADSELTSPYLLSSLQSPGGATVSVLHTSMGNPGNALSFILGLSPVGSTPFSTIGYFLNPSFVHDPATQGAIQSIGFSLDVSIQTNGPLPPGQAVYVVISQDGNKYVHAFPTPSVPDVYQTVAGTGLQANDFGLLLNAAIGTTDNSQHPNFSAGAMTFGFARGWTENANGPAATTTLTSDNFAIAVSTANAAPALGGWVVMILGLALCSAGVVAKRSSIRNFAG